MYITSCAVNENDFHFATNSIILLIEGIIKIKFRLEMFEDLSFTKERLNPHGGETTKKRGQYFGEKGCDHLWTSQHQESMQDVVRTKM